MSFSAEKYSIPLLLKFFSAILNEHELLSVTYKLQNCFINQLISFSFNDKIVFIISISDK